MARTNTPDTLKKKIALLKIKLRHLTNELRLTREEYEQTAKNYFDIYTNLEKKVDERTGRLIKLQKILKEKNSQLQLMLDSSPVMIFYEDAQRRYIRVNKRFSKIIGVPIRRIIGKSYSELFPDGPGSVFASDSEVLESGKPVVGRSGVVRTNAGEWHITLDMVSYRDGNGKVVGVLGFAVDVTKQKRVEKEKRELQQRIARAEKMEAIGLLAGGVAHDGNNMLTGISGYLQLMEMNLPEDDPNRQYIKGSLAASEQMGHLIDDLLTLTRNVVTIKEPVNLNDIITEYLESPVFRSLKEYHPDMTVASSLSGDLLNIKGVPTNLIKLLMNFVTNAAEAMPNGGEILIETRNQYVEKPINGYDLKIEEGDFVVLAVADNGMGIDDSDLNRIFEPFYTKKITGKSGTGLGMAVVYGIVKDHEGLIDVQSAIGRGSRFEIYFPITKEEISRKKEIVPVEEYIGAGEKILVVDDVEAQREILSEILTRLGYCVACAANGEEAVEYIKNNSADLIVLDMIMNPGIDGLETYRKIIEMHPGQKAVIASGYSKTERVTEAQRLGAGEYIKKPYAFEKIGLAVKAALKKSG